jgi:hypothetical protein
MARAQRVTFTVFDEEDRGVEITARYYPGSRDYFDKSFGNYLPGDPEDVEVLKAVAVDAGADVEAVLEDTDAIDEAARMAADDAAEDYR